MYTHTHTHTKRQTKKQTNKQRSENTVAFVPNLVQAATEPGILSRSKAGILKISVTSRTDLLATQA